ncbi:hypothetical protein ElyMa_004866700 [Elysia marginata]|uniref:Uncharacterized protein n=1 Tax=Elysia marginata TaxID=1093978 RepID=A0AAV4IU02_9GAST|nr:hypothetical protein ElyMa_004866700 [Elysia marginata]
MFLPKPSSLRIETLAEYVSCHREGEDVAAVANNVDDDDDYEEGEDDDYEDDDDDDNEDDDDDDDGDYDDDDNNEQKQKMIGRMGRMKTSNGKRQMK